MLNSIGTTISNAFASVRKQTVELVANTTFGQDQIKAEILKKAEEYHEENKEALKNFLGLESVKKSKKFRKVIKQIKAKADEVFKDATLDKRLSAIAEIVGKHAGEYKSVKDFIKTLKSSKEYNGLKEFSSRFINVENYKMLYELLANKDQKTLRPQMLNFVISTLQTKELENSIIKENKDLEPAVINEEIKNQANALGKKLGLTKDERKSLIKIYVKLSNRYIEDINKLRNKVVKLLPAFLERELTRFEKMLEKRIEKNLEEQSHKSDKKAILTRHKNKKSAPKIAKEGSEAETLENERKTVKLTKKR